jgi:hypothetical protein
MTFGTWRWWGRQPHAPAAFTPRKCSWYLFSLGAESIPGPWCGRKDYVTEKYDTTGNRSRDRRRAAQRLKHYAIPGPDTYCNTNWNTRDSNKFSAIQSANVYWNWSSSLNTEEEVDMTKLISKFRNILFRKTQLKGVKFSPLCMNFKTEQITYTDNIRLNDFHKKM